MPEEYEIHRALLERSKYSHLGPFSFDGEGVVTAQHPRRNQKAFRFKGKYHRHHFYVFRNNFIVFLNDEDDNPLW